MATQVDVVSEVGTLVQRLKGAAADEVEAFGLVRIAMIELNKQFNVAGVAAEEKKAALVLEMRAARDGVTVASLKDAAGSVANVRGDAMSAAQTLDVVIFDEPDAQAKPASP